MRWLTRAAFGSSLALLVGCGGGDERCVSTSEYFATKVYGQALQQCTGCHTAGGLAEQKGAKFMLHRETYPDFVSANIEAMRYYAQVEIDGKPLLLRKPLGERRHGGGVVLEESSEDYKILEAFVADLRAGTETTCNAEEALGVENLSARETVRRAGLLLAGRYPTEAEFAAAEAGGNAALRVVVEGFTHDERFYELLREVWNDALLTERGIDAFTLNNYGNAPELYNDQAPGYTSRQREWTSRSMTQEPMRFIEYVVRNDLPFSDVVAGNYVVANPYVARGYGFTHSLPVVPENFQKWERFDFSPAQTKRGDTTGVTYGVPVAGVLTTPAFLQRWETTPTNRGRKRARVVLKNFLATDILKFAQRPVDSTALTSVQNPTMNSPMCTVCHTVMDPVAGAFRGFGENEMTRFNSADKWHDDMFPPGVNGAQMPPSDYGSAIMWLGAQLPRDSRFALSIAQTMYQGLIGDPPLAYPTDRSDPAFADKVRAYTLQSEWLLGISRKFEREDLNLRKLVVDIVDSTYFRAKSGEANGGAVDAALGTGRLLTPEQLSRKTQALTGLYYFAYDSINKDERRAHDGYRRNELVDDADWRLLYGGIDSGDVPRRADTISPIMLAAAQYTAGIVACRATSYDFTKPQAARRLFRGVEMTTVPFTPRANASLPLVEVPGAEAAIRANLVSLAFRLWGETLAADAPEISQMFSLFVDVWKDLEAADVAGTGSKGMWNYRCVAERDWDAPAEFTTQENGDVRPAYKELPARPDGAAYEPGMRLSRDENYTVRSWQAVLTYMLSDYRFLHE